ncbi:MAG TPA: hypothetical protein VGG17_00010 [Acidimicrobiales bacterium]|jgi:hypothetical protein
MKFHNHVVVVITLLVVGTSAILGVTVASTSSCQGTAATFSSHNVVLSQLCTNELELTCATSLPGSAGSNVHLWGVQEGCFGLKP